MAIGDSAELQMKRGVLFTLPLLVGCFPVIRTREPGVSAIVVDDRSGQPIRGATISETGPLLGRSDDQRAQLPDGEQHARSTVTDANGYFKLPTLRYLGFQLLFPPVDPMATCHRVRIEAASHEPRDEFFNDGEYVNDPGTDHQLPPIRLRLTNAE